MSPSQRATESCGSRSATTVAEGPIQRRGSGLIGLTDRVDALAGTIEVASPVGVGTTLLITLPIQEG